MTTPWIAISRKGRQTVKLRSATVRFSAETSAPLIPAAEFREALCLERRRAERSGCYFLLMLLDGPAVLKRTLPEFGDALLSSFRETDVRGWYRDGEVLGVIFTELKPDAVGSALQVLNARVDAVLRTCLETSEADGLEISFHLFPEPSGLEGDDAFLYPDLGRRGTLEVLVKRSMDILASAAGLVLLAPLFTVIALAVKLTSPGPVFYRQVRVGLRGRSFTFLKFRSMYARCAATPHREFVTRFIKGEDGDGVQAIGAVFKLTEDPRVTPVGKFLRKTSLDELPQLFNVLIGEMSLVGPRPPVPYEVELYDAWHRRRVLEVKPGVTGLWQVSGRSRTSFDDMVRLDLRYLKNRSLWLDAWILLRTPWAVLSGDGAY
jgi:lipopolysaccharide/colanic/teichoic acid biosynthesis glycosyltransferase